ncbi:MAG: dihydrolipoamide acetyltransferase, partial [Brevundimonas sp.]
MKTTAVSVAALLLLAGAAQAQTAAPPTQTTPPAPSSDFTRDLNGGPPAPATYLAPAPTPVTAPPDGARSLR